MSIPTLKKRLIFSLSAILLLAFLGTSILNYEVSRESVRKELTTSALPLTRDTIYSEIHQRLMQPFNVSSAMANDAFLKGWILAGEGNLGQLTKYLSDIQRKYGYFSAFYVSTLTGNYYHSGGVLKKMSHQDAHDVWFYDFIQSGLEYRLDVDTNQAAENILTIFINFRVHDDSGRLLGVTGVGLKMDQVAKLLEDTEKKYGRELFMVDTRGLIQVHPDRSLILRQNIRDMPGLSALAGAILADREAPADYEYRRGTSRTLLTVRYLEDLDWFLLVEQDEATTLAAARTNLVSTLTIGFLASLVIIALSLFTVNHFQRRLERMAVTDELTGLFNRRAFGTQFEKARARLERTGQPFCVLLMDIDRFKEINDRKGHLHGDRVLKAVAEAARTHMRPTDHLSRWGGDEFAALVECGLPEARAIAERIRGSLRPLDDDEAAVTLSCGVTQYRPDETLDELFQRVDEVLYTCKEGRQGQVVSV